MFDDLDETAGEFLEVLRAALAADETLSRKAMAVLEDIYVEIDRLI